MNEKSLGLYIRGDGEFEMNPEREAHLQFIKDEFVKAVDAKYRIGQVEHGGNLFEKKGMLKFALEEVIDLYVYLKTLQQQNETKNPPR